MIALRPFTLALTFFTPRELLELSVETLNIPTHRISTSRNVDGEIRISFVRNYPINVTIFGDHLEACNRKRHFFQSNTDTGTYLFFCPCQCIKMHISCFFVHAYQAI